MTARPSFYRGISEPVISKSIAYSRSQSSLIYPEQSQAEFEHRNEGDLRRYSPSASLHSVESIYLARRRCGYQWEDRPGDLGYCLQPTKVSDTNAGHSLVRSATPISVSKIGSDTGCPANDLEAHDMPPLQSKPEWRKPTVGEKTDIPIRDVEASSTEPSTRARIHGDEQATLTRSASDTLPPQTTSCPISAAGSPIESSRNSESRWLKKKGPDLRVFKLARKKKKEAKPNKESKETLNRRPTLSLFQSASDAAKLSPVHETPRTPLSTPKEFIKSFFSPKKDNSNPFDNQEGGVEANQRRKTKPSIPNQPHSDDSHRSSPCVLTTEVPSKALSGLSEPTSNEYSAASPSAVSSPRYERPPIFKRFFSNPGPSNNKQSMKPGARQPRSVETPPLLLVPTVAAPIQNVRTAQYLTTEARRVATPPMQRRKCGKPKGYFWDFAVDGDESPDSFHQPFPMPEINETEDTKKRMPRTPEGEERDWFRVRMDWILSDDSPDGNDELRIFEWDIPEHLPSSPLCPLHPSHPSGGKGICVYHGRRKTRGGEVEDVGLGFA
jgi:hypothetical protein